MGLLTASDYATAGTDGIYKTQLAALGNYDSSIKAVRVHCPACVPLVSAHANTVGGYIWVQFRGDQNYDGSYGKLTSTYQVSRVIM